MMITTQKILRKPNSLLWLCAMVIGCTGCTVQQGARPQQPGALYDREDGGFHPQWIVFHPSDDSTTVFFRLPATDLLPARSSANESLQLALDFQYALKDSSGQVLTKGAAHFEQANDAQQVFWMGQVTLSSPMKRTQLEIELSDAHRNQRAQYKLLCDKSDRFGSQNFLIRDFHTSQPVFGASVSSGDWVECHHPRTMYTHPALALHFTDEAKLPPPPFSTNAPEIPTVEQGKSVRWISSDTLLDVLEANSGFYFITCDPAKRRGLTLLVTDEFFPQIQRVQTMHLPMRFITTKTEYDEISKSSTPRAVIERFWIESAGSKEQARGLIKTYYSRVEEANHAFSSYTEGWRTDRGMIHIIFGNPQRITRDAQREVWEYGENPQIGIVRFVFNKKSTPLSDEVYVLQRSADYRYAWERLVLLWRQGKIFTD